MDIHISGISSLPGLLSRHQDILLTLSKDCLKLVCECELQDYRATKTFQNAESQLLNEWVRKTNFTINDILHIAHVRFKWRNSLK